MVNVETLFSILRFVALVAPAMAIFMQVLNDSGEEDSAAFRFLEMGLVLVTLGGSIILIQILRMINNVTTQFAIVLIFTSLIALAGGVAWKAIPATDTISVSVNSVRDIPHIVVEMIVRLVAFSLVFSSPLLVYEFGEGLTRSYFVVGGFKAIGEFGIHFLMVVVFTIMSFRLLIYLISVGYLTGYSARELLNESTTATIAGHLILILIISVPFILAHLSVALLSRFIDVTVNHPIFSFSYMWIFVSLIAIFSIDLWAEEEDYPRLATDKKA